MLTFFRTSFEHGKPTMALHLSCSQPAPATSLLPVTLAASPMSSPPAKPTQVPVPSAASAAFGSLIALIFHPFTGEFKLRSPSHLLQNSTSRAALPYRLRALSIRFSSISANKYTLPPIAKLTDSFPGQRSAFRFSIEGPSALSGSPIG